MFLYITIRLPDSGYSHFRYFSLLNRTGEPNHMDGSEGWYRISVAKGVDPFKEKKVGRT